MTRFSQRLTSVFALIFTTLFCITTSCMTVFAAPATNVKASEKTALPNIVIIYADDMGYGDVKAQSRTSKIPTPNIDQLARDGLRLTDAHSSACFCSPSRYALMTGRYHWRKHSGIVKVYGPSMFDAKRLTLPEMLKEKGYATACIGKWHMGWNWDAVRKAKKKVPGKKKPEYSYDWSQPIKDGPTAHGFDYYFGDDVPNYPPYTWIENDRVVTVPTEQFKANPVPKEGSAQGRPGLMAPNWRLDAVMPTMTKKAVEWIGKQHGTKKPFFLYFPWTSPHAPIVPTKKWQGSTKAGPYGDFVHQSDFHTGEILAALKKHGFEKNTIIVFACDNGPEWFAYDRIKKTGHQSAGPLRGLKRDLWEGGHRTPMIIRWPKVIQSKRVSGALVSQIDLMATFAAVVGYQLPDSAAEDSHNLLPLLQGKAGAEKIRQTIIHSHPVSGRKNELKYAIRHGNWLLVDAPSGATVKGRIPQWYDKKFGYQSHSHKAELFDLSNDLSERNNLVAKQPKKVTELRALLKQFKERSSSAPRLLKKIKPAKSTQK